MRRRTSAVITLLTASLVSTSLPVLAGDDRGDVRHVLLISVDGLHALDLANYVKNRPGSALAQLSQRGITYSNATSAKPSDSFPGLLALVTGGSPNSTGVWYDDSYDRSLYPPGSHCAGAAGTEVVYDESIDFDSNKLDGGGGINPAALPLRLRNGKCSPVYPHDYLRVNTIFEVIRKAGLRTAWSDKHPSYDIVNGPSGKGVDDLYTPEIAANNSAATGGILDVQQYDSLKVQAILNQINGKDSTGAKTVGVPAIFGMNFQAVSVGQKLTGNGYLDADGTPSAGLAQELDFVDQSLGKFVQGLTNRGLLDRTLIIVTAKHGQSPIDPSRFQKIPGSVIPGALSSAGIPAAQATQDDISLVWLQNQAQAGQAAKVLNATPAAGLDFVLWGTSLTLAFNDPLNDPRVPDVIGLPKLGVVYTTSSKKIAEHGGFGEPDTHVALLVSGPGLHGGTIKSAVETTQVAPTILKALGLDPARLDAVQKEKTVVLPGPDAPGYGGDN